ncbi:hypothetical protein GCM10020000_49240 [Streptomyces olivoverticillatus]
MPAHRAGRTISGEARCGRAAACARSRPHRGPRTPRAPRTPGGAGDAKGAEGAKGVRRHQGRQEREEARRFHTPPGGGRSRAARIARWSALGLAVLILGVSAAGYLYYEHLNGNIKKNKLNLGDKQLDRSVANADGQRPLNILLLGSDSRASKANQELGGARDDADRPALADVQMLLHVSADRSNMSVISVPPATPG